MSHLLRAFPAFLRVSIQAMLQYRGEILLWCMWGIVNPTVLYVMWSAATRGAPDGKIAGLDQNGFAVYYFFLLIVGHLTAAWDVYNMSYLVRKGQLSPLLLRPILPMWESLSSNLAYKITTLMFAAPMWLIFILITQPSFQTEWWQVGLGTIALLLGAALNYMLCYTVALVAFWTTKLDAVGEIYFGLGMLLGGRMAPVDALPPYLQIASELLPFKWMFAFPVEVLAGMRDDVNSVTRGLLIQAVWVVLVVMVFRMGWHLAVKRYSAVSG